MAKYRKDIIKVSKIKHPVTGEDVDISNEYLQSLIAKTKDYNHKTFVPFRHSKNPKDNTGFIDGFEVENGVLYGNFDIDDKIGKKYIDTGRIKLVSIGIEGFGTGNDYINHVALTSDPHFKEQNDFVQMESNSNLVYFENKDLTEWGGDTMSNETGMMDKFQIYLERKAVLDAENTQLKSDKLELESANSELTTKLKEVEGKVLALETANKDHADKLELEAKTLEAEAREAIFDKAFTEMKLKPADIAKKKVELESFDNTQLAMYFEALSPELELEKKTAVNPNDIDSLELEASEKEHFEKWGIDPTEENIKFYRKQLKGGGE